MLEKVSSCEIRYQSWPILLILGGLLLLGGTYSFFQMGGVQLAGPAIVFGLVFLCAYFLTRKHLISISSDGGASIGFETTGLKRDAVIAFINGIEEAKNQRCIFLSQFSSPLLG